MEASIERERADIALRSSRYISMSETPDEMEAKEAASLEALRYAQTKQNCSLHEHACVRASAACITGGGWVGGCEGGAWASVGGRGR